MTENKVYPTSGWRATFTMKALNVCRCCKAPLWGHICLVCGMNVVCRDEEEIKLRRANLHPCCGKWSDKDIIES